ncbi:hypothetical protein NUU61_008502 [Penicillium alfredii]|uniref:DUF6590 domain-containing protein n=1 Tax=Penicillium alfredii TaxID=1506179 RepID=A0A9W9JWA5_9EURO|nr:uncharacterized protein NUU61_008502 [Penicillium alfredii]KAJ5083923.1 hypothetical protein NUU61_008502 [Penicillium alfredii]
MASDSAVHPESRRLFRPVYNLAGEPCYKWDKPRGPLSPVPRIADRSSITPPRQRSTSDSESLQPSGYAIQFAHGQGNTGRHDHATQQQQGLSGFGLRSPSQHQLSGPRQKDVPSHSRATNNLRQSRVNAYSTQRGDPPEWNSSKFLESMSREPTAACRTGQTSVSDNSEATASSWSGTSSPRSIAVDLQGFGLGDHASSRLILPHGISCRSHRHDPILGDVQRNHDTSVRLSVEPSYVIPASTGEDETLDPRYKRQSDPKRFFRVGRVFAMLWHENAGLHGTILSQRGPPLGPHFTRGKYQEPIYSSIRRMVVVKEQKGCSWCVPVTTYSGQGVAKAGVDRGKHAVIYMQGNRPAVNPGEPRMIKEPLEVEPARPDQRLDPMSRLNFGKVYTVEHNVKVLPVGKIAEESMARFIAYARAEFTR